jgi:hypothetical protein
LADQVRIKSISTWKEVTINKETKAAPLHRQPSTNPTTTTSASTNSSSSSSSRNCFDCCFRRRRVDTSYHEYTTVASTTPAIAAEEESRRPQLRFEAIDYLGPLDCCVTHQDLMTWRPRRQVIFTALHTCSTDTTASTDDELNIIHDSVRSTEIFHKSRRRMAKCNVNNVNDEATLFLLTTNGAIAISGQEADFGEFIATKQVYTPTIKQLVFDIISLYRASEHFGVFSIAPKQLLPVNKS